MSPTVRCCLKRMEYTQTPQGVGYLCSFCGRFELKRKSTERTGYTMPYKERASSSKITWENVGEEHEVTIFEYGEVYLTSGETVYRVACEEDGHRRFFFASRYLQDLIEGVRDGTRCKIVRDEDKPSTKGQPMHTFRLYEWEAPKGT